MPELAEVEVIRKQAEKEIVGSKFRSVRFSPNGNALKLRIKRDVAEILPGKEIKSVKRVAKTFALILIIFSSHPNCL